MAKYDVRWEVMDNFQKQTYRNRSYICTDAGRHMLNIPIKHIGGDQGRQKYREVKLDNSYAWQRQHWRTLETAYRTSPFFEFYEDELVGLYQRSFTYLLDFNLKTIETVCQSMGMGMPTLKTEAYEKTPVTSKDARFLVNAKRKVEFKQQNYVQVFGDRHGFIENTSILDLLFNEGSNALSYLRNQEIDFLDV